MTVDFAHTTTAERNRARKVLRLVRWIENNPGPIPVDKLSTSTDADRRWLERAAGVRRCSDTTWHLVLTRLREGASS